MLPPNFSHVLPGRLAGMGCPPMDGGALTDALIDLGREGITAVVSLTEYAPSADGFALAGFMHLHAPIPDFTPPTRAQIDEVVAFTRAAWAAGRGVAVHCGAGIGRTGTLLACVLVSEGESADAAMAMVRLLRPGSIETKAQESAIKAYAAGGGSA